MRERRDNFYVVTGASGSGKPAIIAALKRRGHLCVDEVGRQIVQQQMRIGGDATTWQDHVKLRELILSGAIHAFETADEKARPVYFDRGIPEGIAYSRLLKVEVPDHHFRAAYIFRYSHTVFVTPPWEEIYTNDAERRHTFEEGVEAYNEIVAAYTECGYTLIDVPNRSVEGRVDFILAHSTGNAA